MKEITEASASVGLLLATALAGISNHELKTFGLHFSGRTNHLLTGLVKFGSPGSSGDPREF